MPCGLTSWRWSCFIGRLKRLAPAASASLSSVLSQSLTIFAMLTGYQFVLFWVDGATGNPVVTYSRWLAPVIGGLIWPLVAGLLSKSRAR
jgi:cell shape-determining protein MreD